MTLAKATASGPLKAFAFATLLVSLSLTPVMAAAPEPAARAYKVGGRVLEGRPKTVCVIEGSWADGEYFYYEGWDACSELWVSSASLADYKDWEPRGRKGSLTVADIPAGSETIEISNDFSSVLVFRDRNGEMQEVLIRD